MSASKQTAKINLISKGRKYFKAKLNDKYDCKFVIDNNSEKLELNTDYELIVEDVSIRTKFGTDLIFSMITETKKQEGVVCLQHDRYNTLLVRECQNLAGKYDVETKSYTFNKIYEKEVEELDWEFNSDLVTVDIKAKEDIIGSHDSVYFCGYPIVRAFGRDSGAKLCQDIGMISGKIGSGGSVKNWSTRINKGAIFRLQLSKNLLEEYRKIEESEWEITIAGELK